jgi:hypothetical protein
MAQFLREAFRRTLFTGTPDLRKLGLEIVLPLWLICHWLQYSKIAASFIAKLSQREP